MNDEEDTKNRGEEGSSLLFLLTSDVNGASSTGGSCGMSNVDSFIVSRLLNFLRSATSTVNSSVGVRNSQDGSVAESSDHVQNQTRRDQEIFEKVVIAALDSCQLINSTNGVTAIEGKLGRRVIVDGLLPLSNMLISSQQMDAADQLGICRVTTGLLRRCVDSMVNVALEERNISVSGLTSSRVSRSTVALELLLPSYLARLDSVPPGKVHDTADTQQCASNFVDRALDKLCGCVRTWNICPYAAAAVAASLRELDSILPGRLYVDAAQQGQSVRNAVAGRKTRIDVLVDELQKCMLRFGSVDSDGTDLDALPPLVYQLCLLGGRLSCTNERQRMKCLVGIAYRFDDILISCERASSEKVDRSNNKAEFRREEALHWALSTALSHIATALRQDQEMSKCLYKLLRNGYCEGTSSVVSEPTSVTLVLDEMKPFRFLRVTPFRIAMALLLSASNPRSKQECHQSLRDLIVEECSILHKHTSSSWLRRMCSALQQKTCAETSEREEEKERHESHVLSCLSAVARFASTESRADGGAGDAILHSLVQLSFFLVDAAKKDRKWIAPFSNTRVVSIASTSDAVLINNMVASIGREFLCSLIRRGDDSLRRSVVTSASSRLCGRAPNAIEHSLIFPELTSRDDEYSHKDSAVHENDGLEPLSEYGSQIVDWLGHLAGGGLHPLVVHISIIPTLRSLLRLPNMRRYIGSCFMFAKKAQLCPDVEIRCAASSLFMMLLEVVVYNRTYRGSNTKAGDSITSATDELCGYIRRSLTQQDSVRITVYTAIFSALARNSNSSPNSSKEMDNAAMLHNLPSLTRPGRAQMRDNDLSLTFATIASRQLERYIQLGEQKADAVARRRRAIVRGSLLSQQVDDEEDNEQGYNESTPLAETPFRWEICITNTPSMGCVQFSGRKGMRKALSEAKDRTSQILTESRARIMEPLDKLLMVSFIVAKCIQPENNLELLLSRLRGAFADVSCDRHIKWCKNQGHAFDTLPATLLMARVATSLFVMECMANHSGIRGALAGDDGISVVSDYKENKGSRTVEHLKQNTNLNQRPNESRTLATLFEQRCYAIDSAALLLANASRSKATKQRSTVTNKSAKGVIANEDLDDFENSKSSKKETLKISNYSTNVEKMRIMIEESTLADCSHFICPDFLFAAFSTYGISSSKAAQKSSQEIYETSLGVIPQNKTRVLKFLLAATIQYVDSDSALLVAGSRSLNSRDERLISSSTNVSSKNLSSVAIHTLGPQVFAVYCVACFPKRDAAGANISASEEQRHTATLALNAFFRCVKAATQNDIRGRTPAQHVRILLRLSLSMAALAVGKSFETASTSDGAENDIRMLLEFFIVPLRRASSDDRSGCTRSLLVELISRGMDADATLCCETVAVIAAAITNGSDRSAIAISMMQCWEECSGDLPPSGFFNFIACEESNESESTSLCPVAACTAFELAVTLVGNLDSESLKVRGQKPNHTQPSGSPDVSPLREQQADSLSNDIGCSALFQIAETLVSQVAIGANFAEDVDVDEEKIATYGLQSCLKAATSEQDSGVTSKSKKFAEACESLSIVISSAIADAEFVMSKVVPHLSDLQLVTCQNLAFGRLLTVARLISVLSPIAENIDDTCSFATDCILRCSKRVYVIYAKLVLTHANRPKQICSESSTRFLRQMTVTMTPRVMTLLLSTQEKARTSEGKLLADSKIESQGRIAAQLVYEKERSDNALLKLSSKLKSCGLSKESVWLESNVVASASRDFRIRKGEIRVAQERESRGKRKAVEPEKLPSKRKSKAKKRVKGESGDSNEEVSVDISSIGTDGIKSIASADGEGDIAENMSITVENSVEGGDSSCGGDNDDEASDADDNNGSDESKEYY